MADINVSDWRTQRKIVTMPMGEANTPEVVLARTLEKAVAGHIRGIVVSILWDDESTGSDFSYLNPRDALYITKSSQLWIEDWMRSDETEDLFP